MQVRQSHYVGRAAHHSDLRNMKTGLNFLYKVQPQSIQPKITQKHAVQGLKTSRAEPVSVVSKDLITVSLILSY